MLASLPSNFDSLSVQEFRKKYGKPDVEPISRADGKTLTKNIPTHAVVPLYLGKNARDFTLSDVRGFMLSDFGEAFSPQHEERLGKDCHMAVARRPPEAMFEPDRPLSYPSDVWSLATAIWETVGMKFIFSESEPEDEVIAEQIDVFGAETFPPSWRTAFERQISLREHGVSPLPRRPEGRREVWPPLEEAFEEFVQKSRRKREATAGIFGNEESRAFLDLMRGMMRFLPEDRLTMEEVLK